MRSYSKKLGRNWDAPSLRRTVSTLVVRARPGQPTKGILRAGPLTFPCALGRGGITANKREGDGGTPLGTMRLLGGYFRRDHVAPAASWLRLKPIGETLGWCEVPGDRNYNRPVRMPYAASHERMRRDDTLYDLVIVLDWNIAPRHRGRGSAIFFHLARPGFEPTAGCVAVTERTMQRLLPHLRRGMVMRVVR